MADLANPYRMLPADDGGESYQMECEFCHAWGNVMQRDPFRHALPCPAGIAEQEEFAAMRKREQKKGTTMEPTVELTKGQRAKRAVQRGLVRFGYLMLLSLITGVILGITGAGFGPHPLALIGVMLVYWGTIGDILTKFGIAKPPKVPTVAQQ